MSGLFSTWDASCPPLRHRQHLMTLAFYGQLGELNKLNQSCRTSIPLSASSHTESVPASTGRAAISDKGCAARHKDKQMQTDMSALSGSHQHLLPGGTLDACLAMVTQTWSDDIEPMSESSRSKSAGSMSSPSRKPQRAKSVVARLPNQPKSVSAPLKSFNVPNNRHSGTLISE